MESAANASGMHCVSPRQSSALVSPAHPERRQPLSPKENVLQSGAFAQARAHSATSPAPFTVTKLPAQRVPAADTLDFGAQMPFVWSQLCVPSWHGCILVGAGDGDAVGGDVGDAVGNEVGASVGEIVGDWVGVGVGPSVGDNVGPNVGASVGASVGDREGDWVGDTVTAMHVLLPMVSSTMTNPSLHRQV